MSASGQLGLARSYSDVVLLGLMAWSEPKYTRSRVDAAGKLVAENPASARTGLESQDVIDAIGVVNNWRASHSFPLYAIRRTLESRAKKISEYSIVAHRMKRFPSIERKLSDNAYRHMALTQIQDIGGCRAIMPSIEEVFRLVEIYTKQSRMQSVLLREPSDFISKPKDDGYRGVHLVYKFQSKKVKAFNGHRIEIQIRSALQHAWATAAEMLLTFTTIPVRETVTAYNSLPRDPQEIALWRRFFKLMSSAIAKRENQPIVANTPGNEAELISELRTVANKLNVVTVLNSWSKLIVWYEDSNSGLPGSLPSLSGASQFLLQLTPPDGRMPSSLHITPFTHAQAEDAFKFYMILEAEQRTALNKNVVLVSVDSIDELKSAYPNYWGDTDLFVRTLKELIQ